MFETLEEFIAKYEQEIRESQNFDSYLDEMIKTTLIPVVRYV